MKDYIKPTFILAGLAPVALAGTNCSMTESLKNRLERLYGIEDWSQAFVNADDGCSEYFDSSNMYCKYTSEGIATPITVLGS